MDARVETALRELARDEPDVEAVARRAWDDLTGGSGEARDVSQWWLQLYCWDQLARSSSGTPEEKWRTAQALADLLDRVGLRRYAALARSDATHEVLIASDDLEEYSDRYAAALRASGIQPPDTDLITWGPVMGPAEADTYERAANALELALVSGDVVPGGRGSRRARAAVTDAVLTTPQRDLRGLRPLHGIASERLHEWTVRSATLARLLEPLGEELTSGIPVPLAGASGALRPLAVLLGLLAEPVPLTSAGYLPPAVVADVVTRAGLEDRVIGPSRREVDVPHVHLLRDAAQRTGLVRVHRRALSLTPRGRRAVTGDAELARAVVVGWFPPRRTAEVVAREVVTALMATGEQPTSAEVGRLTRQVLTEDGWRVSGGPVPLEAAESVSWQSRRDLLYLGLAPDRLLDLRWNVVDAAVPLLRAALRHHLMHHGLTQPG